MRLKHVILLAIGALAGFPLQAMADPINLGTADNYGVLAGTTVTNTGATVINNGNVGVSPGSSITGFGTVTGTYVIDNGNAGTAQTDLTTAYVEAAGLAPDGILTGMDLGGLTLTPGVYFFSSSAGLTGTLTLDAMGDPFAEWVFQIGSTLITASGASVIMTNTGTGEPGCNVFWQVGSSATLGTSTTFLGHIMALTSITMQTNSSILGSVLARNGAVTLDSNTITNCFTDGGDNGNGGNGNGGNGNGNGNGGNGSVPEPATTALALVAAALLGLRALGKRRPRSG